MMQLLGTAHAISLPERVLSKIAKDNLLQQLEEEGSRVAKTLRNSRHGFVANVRRRSQRRNPLSLLDGWSSVTIHLYELARDDIGALHLGADGRVYRQSSSRNDRYYRRETIENYSFDALHELLGSIRALAHS